MDLTLLLLRVVHVVGGVFWAGAILFVVHFLEPAVRAAGPDGARFMLELRKRHYLNVVPVIAALTLVSGFWLYWRVFGRLHPGPGASGAELTLGIGGLFALVAFVVGVTTLRPSALRIGALGAELAQAPPDRREALGTELARLRGRMRLAGRVVAVLLGIAIVTMAVGRYV
jgi:uncharacterized membrane protein